MGHACMPVLSNDSVQEQAKNHGVGAPGSVEGSDLLLDHC